MTGFSVAFDLISSEYGWVDEDILKIPLYRLQQQVATIQLRLYENMRVENSRTSWQTRVLATYIANGYMSDGKSENGPLKEAQYLAMDDVERTLLKEVAMKPKVYENTPGSFERLTGSFGM